MKIFKIILVIIVVLVIAGFIHNRKGNSNQNYLEKLGSGDYHFTIQDQGHEREYYVYVPKSYSEKNPTPVIFEFHGGGGTAEKARNQSLLDLTADKKGFIVVWPDSTGSQKEQTKNWNVGGRFQAEKNPDVDDVKFVEAVYKQIKEKLNIDENKVFATGISNGGMMTYQMACFSNIFKAIAPIETATITDTCPSGPIPVLHMHGTLDEFIPFNGGPATVMLNGKLVGPQDDFKSFAENRDFWLQHNQCDATSRVYYEKGGAQCLAYDNCAAESVFCRIENHGHTWPGGKYPLDIELYRNLTGPISNDLDANELMWKFFTENSK